jgi:pantoate--beta-alanine ligase
MRVDPGPIGTVLEGARRPGHFTGVATIVARLFAIIRPDLATFGEKDAQQLRVIMKLSRELGFGVEIVPIPIVRDPDGLAMSTRNMYLSGEDRKAAAVLYRSLCGGRKAWLSGERDADRVRNVVEAVLDSEPRVRRDYVSLAHPETLSELHGPVTGEALLSLAARVGPTRLIDNVLLR